MATKSSKPGPDDQIDLDSYDQQLTNETYEKAEPDLAEMDPERRREILELAKARVYKPHRGQVRYEDGRAYEGKRLGVGRLSLTRDREAFEHLKSVWVHRKPLRETAVARAVARAMYGVLRLMLRTPPGTAMLSAAQVAEKLAPMSIDDARAHDQKLAALAGGAPQGIVPESAESFPSKRGQTPNTGISVRRVQKIIRGLRRLADNPPQPPLSFEERCADAALVQLGRLQKSAARQRPLPDNIAFELTLPVAKAVRKLSDKQLDKLLARVPVGIERSCLALLNELEGNGTLLEDDDAKVNRWRGKREEWERYGVGQTSTELPICPVCRERFERQRVTRVYCGDRCRAVANRRRQTHARPE